jgi:hypothetical protein
MILVGTRCGAVPDLLRSGGGALIDVNCHDSLQSAMGEYCEMDTQKWLKLSNSAVAEAGLHTWDDKVVEFERAIYRA